MRRVRQEKEDDEGHADGRYALDKEQQAPIGKIGMAGRDAVCEGSGEAGGERSSGEEEADARADLVSEVEEAEQIWTGMKLSEENDRK